MNDYTQLSTLPQFDELTKERVENLRLDTKNPRIAMIENDSTAEDIIAYLYKTQDLAELLDSIAANGYMDIEPLIVLEEENKLVVLEGNRRLASLRLLREPNLADQIHSKHKFRISIPKLRDDIASSLDEVTVCKVSKRSDARSFIGFKHVNGAARWESFAKAKFAAQWFEDGTYTLDEIARCIGDRHETIKRMINGIFVLNQAESYEIYNIDDRANSRFSFSHLYTALSRPPYIKFLNLSAEWARNDPMRNPIPESGLKHLGEMLVWIYGSKDESRPPVVRTQNPDIKRLGDVIESPEALEILRASDSLDEAHESTRDIYEKLSESLIKAREEIRNSQNSLRGYNSNHSTLLIVAEDIFSSAGSIVAWMRKKDSDAAEIKERNGSNLV